MFGDDWFVWTPLVCLDTTRVQGQTRVLIQDFLVPGSMWLQHYEDVLKVFQSIKVFSGVGVVRALYSSSTTECLHRAFLWLRTLSKRKRFGNLLPIKGNCNALAYSG